MNESSILLGQDDTVYAEHRPAPLKMMDRPPSSPSRFDLRRRMSSSQSQFYTGPPAETVPICTNTPLSRFDIVHRPPSRNRVYLSPRNTDITSVSKPFFFGEEKTQQPTEKKVPRPRTSPPIPTYEVKRGSKIYKVVVGYVSPFTSPLQRTELNLKTDGEVDIVIQQIKQQQEIDRANKQQIWLGLPPQST